MPIAREEAAFAVTGKAVRKIDRLLERLAAVVRACKKDLAAVCAAGKDDFLQSMYTAPGSPLVITIRGSQEKILGVLETLTGGSKRFSPLVA